MKKPVIGIASKLRKQDPHDLWHRQEVVDELRYLVVKHGGIAVMLLPSEMTYEFNESDLGDDKILNEEEVADLHTQVDLCDGIILQGGDYSCAYEEEIARYALKKDIPLLGICAGFNNILRALGSNVHEDKSHSHSVYDKNYRHLITIKKDNLLYDILQKAEYPVNSFHTMVADKKDVEDYGRICACSEDGLVECFDLPAKKFVLAVKWHPEIMQEDAYVDKLFQSFIAAAN